MDTNKKRRRLYKNKNMNKKIENLKDLNYQANISLISRMILEARNKKESEKLKKMSQAITEIAFYVNNLQMDRWAYNKSLKEYRNDKNRAIARARKSEEELEKLQKKYKIII